MFSDHMHKIDKTSGRNLLLIAAGLVIICQLVAIALVADGQVKRAELRESNLNLQRVALARCLEANARLDSQTCLQQASAESTNAVAANGFVSASTDMTDEVPTKRRSGTQANFFGASPQAKTGMMSVAFN